MSCMRTRGILRINYIKHSGPVELRFLLYTLNGAKDPPSVVLNGSF